MWSNICQCCYCAANQSKVCSSFQGSPREASIDTSNTQHNEDTQASERNSVEDEDRGLESNSAGPSSDSTADSMEDPPGDQELAENQALNNRSNNFPRKEQTSKHSDGKPSIGKTVKKDSKSTVFIRGLPLDCPQHVLQAELERFGPLRSCLLVENKETRKLKGTAFVEFVSERDAEMALEYCKKAR